MFKDGEFQEGRMACLNPSDAIDIRVQNWPAGWVGWTVTYLFPVNQSNTSQSGLPLGVPGCPVMQEAQRKRVLIGLDLNADNLFVCFLSSYICCHMRDSATCV